MDVEKDLVDLKNIQNRDDLFKAFTPVKKSEGKILSEDDKNFEDFAQYLKQNAEICDMNLNNYFKYKYSKYYWKRILETEISKKSLSLKDFSVIALDFLFILFRHLGILLLPIIFGGAFLDFLISNKPIEYVFYPIVSLLVVFVLFFLIEFNSAKSFYKKNKHFFTKVISDYLLSRQMKEKGVDFVVKNIPGDSYGT